MNTTPTEQTNRAIGNLYAALADLYHRRDDSVLFPNALKAVEIETERLAVIADTLRGKEHLAIGLEASRAITVAQAAVRTHEKIQAKQAVRTAAESE